MIRKTALIKMSGDLCSRFDVLEWARKVTGHYFVVICVGGGTQINQAFADHDLPVGKFGPLGRETKDLEERQLARDILEENQATLQDVLAEMTIPAVVVIPVLELGTVLCHVNGDIFTLAAYHGYDKIYVATLEDRADQKRKIFSDYPKIEVVGFPKEAT